MRKPRPALPDDFPVIADKQPLAWLDRSPPLGNKNGILISLDTYRGNQFVRIQDWIHDGFEWHPVPYKQITIRRRDAADAIEALKIFASIDPDA